MNNYCRILLQLSPIEITDFIIFSNWKFKETYSADTELKAFLREDFYKTGHPRTIILERRNESINELLLIIEQLTNVSIQKVRIHQESVNAQLLIIGAFIKEINGYATNLQHTKKYQRS